MIMFSQLPDELGISRRPVARYVRTGILAAEYPHA